jgi:beta-xylosidase
VDNIRITRSSLARPMAALTLAVLGVLCASVTVTSAGAATATITPGVAWTDTEGNRLQAHGAGVFTVGSTYYMVGEDKSAGKTFTAVACYSSTDLVHWARQANALSRQATGDLAGGRIVERPKVLYNSVTGKYVMWMHIDNDSYDDRRAGVATSTTPCGPYTYLGATDPLGRQSRDVGLFKDDDGSAYLMHDDAAGYLRVDRLSADYTTAESAVASFPGLEAPAIAKVGGRYVLLASHLTGWSTNDNVYASALSLSGPWSEFSNVAAAGTRTYDSQTSFLLPVTGSAGTSYVYIGDRWNAGDLNSSLPVWLPITLTSSGTAALRWYPSWGIDTATGSTVLP